LGGPGSFSGHTRTHWNVDLWPRLQWSLSAASHLPNSCWCVRAAAFGALGGQCCCIDVGFDNNCPLPKQDAATALMFCAAMSFEFACRATTSVMASRHRPQIASSSKPACRRLMMNSHARERRSVCRRLFSQRHHGCCVDCFNLVAECVLYGKQVRTETMHILRLEVLRTCCWQCHIRWVKV
jgi:hypothetical protein